MPGIFHFGISLDSRTFITYVWAGTAPVGKTLLVIGWTDIVEKNTNTLYDSFNQDFCSDLEFHLCRTFKNSNDDRLRGFWCDGVNHDPPTKSKKSVNDTRQLETIAWLGKTGQDEYKMTIHFGKYSLRRFGKGNDLKDTLPSDQTMDWVNIDPDNQTIEIQLL